MKSPEDIIKEMNLWNESVSLAINNLWSSHKELERRIEKLEKEKVKR